jgi:hypothetical protein
LNEEVAGWRELDDDAGKRVEKGHGRGLANENEPPVWQAVYSAEETGRFLVRVDFHLSATM